MKKYNKIVVFSGAGLDASSGVPTFRDANGLWENHKIEDVCCYPTWLKNYNLVHKFYDDRREALTDIVPNRGHEFIKKWQEQHICLNVTTNVSDLFEKAGVVDTVYLHGNIQKIYCPSCETKVDMQNGRVFGKDGSLNSLLTHKHKKDCTYKHWKPDVVFFGEMAPEYNTLYEVLKAVDENTLIVIVGASNVVIDFVSICSTTLAKIFVVDTNPNLLDNYSPDLDITFINRSADEGLEIVDNFVESNVNNA